MKIASQTLKDFLNAARMRRDAAIAFADCFTFSLAAGTALTYTNADVPIAYKGVVFRADGPLVAGLKYHGSTGLNVDRQEIMIAARPTDLTSGAAILVALRSGAFDGATVRRERVFFSDYIGGTLVDGVVLFQGRVSTVDEVGRTQAKLTVANDLVLLDRDMPRNFYAPTCQNTLYDAACGVARNAYARQTSAQGGSSALYIADGGAQSGHKGGSLIFNSGANVGVRATVRDVNVGGGYALMAALPNSPAAGDQFTVYYGCDRTLGVCQGTFNNRGNFRGFPYVPPPSYAQ